MVWGPHWPGDSLDIYKKLKQLNGIFCNIDPTPSWWYSSWLYTYLTVGLMGLNGCLNLMVDWMWLRARQWCIPLISQTIAKLKFISPLSYPLETPLCIMDTFHMLNFWTEIRCSQTIKTHTHQKKMKKTQTLTKKTMTILSFHDVPIKNNSDHVDWLLGIISGNIGPDALWFFVLEDLWNSKQLQWRFIVTKLKFLIVTYSNYKSLANMYWLSWIKKNITHSLQVWTATVESMMGAVKQCPFYNPWLGMVSLYHL